MTTFTDLGLSAKGSTGGACGCGSSGGCACGGHGAAHAHAGAATAASSQTFGVAGMTCEHCVRSVTEELASYEDVLSVDISLVPDGTSTVTVGSRRPLGRDEIEGAIADAGYRLAPLER